MKNVRLSDYGVYTCKARNDFGHMISNEAYLKIRGLSPCLFIRNHLQTTFGKLDICTSANAVIDTFKTPF